MRIVFMGTPHFAVPVLASIHSHGHEVAAVYTRAPRPAGRRGLALTPSPVQAIAERFGLPVFTPKTFREAAELEIFRGHAADVAIVVAYGMILPRAILQAPARGCFNLHASLLPRWRGAAPLQRAIVAGDVETGVMVMRMEEGLDTGPIAMAERAAIGPDANAGEMHDRLAGLGADLMVRALAALARDTLALHPQSESGVTYAHKIAKEECRIDWLRPALAVHNQIRGLSPAPGAFVEADFGRGPERVKVLRSQMVEAGGAPGTILDDALTAACGEGAVRLVEVQRAGRAPMEGATFLRGVRLSAGARLA
ncbi:MAG: methionyl-tRNA formyltransferase [Beijerinckiaceae bacterium]